MQDSKFPKTDGYSIMNTDTSGGPGIHWMALIRRGQNVYVYDSFGRLSKSVLPHFTKKMQRQGVKVHTADPTDQDQYGYESVDCGHRCISALAIAKKYGVPAFMSL